MENESKVAICTKCSYFNNFDHGCKHTAAPYTEFIHGKKSCHDINCKGECRLYEGEQLAASKEAGSITVSLILDTEPLKIQIKKLLAGLE